MLPTDSELHHKYRHEPILFNSLEHAPNVRLHYFRPVRGDVSHPFTCQLLIINNKICHLSMSLTSHVASLERCDRRFDVWRKSRTSIVELLGIASLQVKKCITIRPVTSMPPTFLTTSGHQVNKNTVDHRCGYLTILIAKNMLHVSACRSHYQAPILKIH